MIPGEIKDWTAKVYSVLKPLEEEFYEFEDGRPKYPFWDQNSDKFEILPLRIRAAYEELERNTED